MIYWLLAREVLYLKGHIPRERQWDVLVDVFEWKDGEAEERKDIEEERRPGATSDACLSPWKSRLK